jgi:hypothetical protein
MLVHEQLAAHAQISRCGSVHAELTEFSAGNLNWDMQSQADQPGIRRISNSATATRGVQASEATWWIDDRRHIHTYLTPLCAHVSFKCDAHMEVQEIAGLRDHTPDT